MKKQPEIISDLHMHSFYSDGYWSPTEVILRAREAGLKEISLTDHNTIAGLQEAEIAARKAGLDFIRGVEINAKSEFENQQFHNHILAYHFDPQIMSRALKKIIKSNNYQFRKLIVNLKKFIKSGKSAIAGKRNPLLNFKNTIEKYYRL